jgi:hypothetical protein
MSVATKPTLRFLCPTAGDFASILGMDEWDAKMYKDAYDATTAADMWETMRNTSTESFMFHAGPWVNEIHTHMKLLDTHSGCSYGVTMRNVELIAKRGWEAYVDAKVVGYEKQLAKEKEEAAAKGEPWVYPQAVIDAGAAVDAAAAARDRADTEEAALDAARLARRPE